MKVLCESILSTMSKPDTSEVKLMSNTVRVHKLLCGEDEPRYLKHHIGLSIVRGEIISVLSEHSTTLIEIRSNESSSRRLTKSCLMDTGASSSIVSLKIIQESWVTIYENLNQEMMLTDASGMDMKIIGITKITINTQANPKVVV